MSSLYSLVLLFLLTIVYAAGDEDIFEVQPEIYHVFREEVRQPSVWISQLFTVISLSPWLVLLLGWLHIGITPKQGTSSHSKHSFTFTGPNSTYSRHWVSCLYCPYSPSSLDNVH
ncbi:hypothetical protein BDB01DRAFT_853273 [Pilobolus umbonatus]|nr:hypothetical protein BDB01DRAFT_853273 [Pilobolus umbonatus]